MPKDCELNHTAVSSFVIHCGVPDFPLELLTMNVANTERKLKQLLAQQAAVYRETLQQTGYFLKVFIGSQHLNPQCGFPMQSC